VQFPIACVTLP